MGSVKDLKTWGAHGAKPLPSPSAWSTESSGSRGEAGAFPKNFWDIPTSYLSLRQQKSGCQELTKKALWVTSSYTSV